MKNINKPEFDVEKLQQRIYELEKIENSYEQVVDAFTEGFVMDLYNQDIIKQVSNETLQRWFSNPDDYMEQITSLLTYYYIVDGNIFQLFDLIFTLPNFDYKITVLEKDEKSKDDLKVIKYFLDKKIRHKELSRDLAVQLASKGTLLGTWLGNKKDPYFHTFDDLQYIYPYGRYNGRMIGVIDLKWLDSKKEEERQLIYNNLNPIVTEAKYNKYKDSSGDSEKEAGTRYVTLPPETSLVDRIHTLSRNQRLGIPFGTQALFDMQHKQKMKDLEKAVANKIIRAIAVLKFKGKDDNDVRVKSADKKKVHNRVKIALEKMGKDDAITCLAIPDFAEFSFPELKNGDKALSPDKYKSINNDITSATGVSDVLSNGTNGNYASANLNLDILYKKIGVIIEKIEIIYNQLIDIVLGKRGENYIFEYNTEKPLSKKERVDILLKLQMQGYSTKAIIDEIGINYEDYFNQSVYEIEELGAREKIIPPQTSYTLSDKGGGRQSEDNPENESTISTKENDGNNNPSTDD